MLAVLSIALFVILIGGSIAINITDTIQGFFCYPMLVVMVIFVLCKFSWSNEIFPVLTDKVPGESMINPADITRLRDFNLFSALALPVLVRFLQRVSWFGRRLIFDRGTLSARAEDGWTHRHLAQCARLDVLYSACPRRAYDDDPSQFQQ